MGFTTTERGVNGSLLAPVVNVDLSALAEVLSSLDSTQALNFNRFALALEAMASAVGILAGHSLNLGPTWLLNSNTSKFHQWIAALDGLTMVPELSQTESWPAYLITTGYHLYLRHQTTMEFHGVSCAPDGSSIVVELAQTGVASPTSPYHVLNWLYDPEGGLWYRLWAATDGTTIVPELNQNGVSIIA